MRSTSHALIAALVAIALVAPAAQAMPDRGPVTSHRGANGGAAPNMIAQRRLPGPPIFPTHMRTIEPRQGVPVQTPAQPVADDRFPWDTVALALAGASLLLVGGVVLAGIRRRSRRPGVAA